MDPAAAAVFSYSDFLAAVTSATFPVAVAGYLLLRLESRLEALTRSIENLRKCQVCRLDESAK